MKKNVLITGGSGNLGHATVTKFLDADYNVIATITPGKSLGFEAKGVHLYEADLTDEKSAESVVKKIFAEHTKLDAALSMGSIHNTDGALMKKMFALNFDTAYFVARPVFEQMLKQPEGGRIILVGSRPGLSPKDGKGSLAYSLSKSLIFRLAEVLNAEGSSKNVTTSVVVPSTIDTEINRKEMPDKDFTTWVKPEQIADTMLFICSEQGKPLRETVLKVYNRA
jgi:NAD(P)-dependent dehydrogenase (short-subunit alcohol dehydrogenase family)